MKNKIEISGADNIYNVKYILSLFLFTFSLSVVASIFGLTAVIGFYSIICSVPIILYIMKVQKSGVIILMFVAFFSAGLKRYIQIPFGLLVDIILLLTVFSIIMQRFYNKDFHEINTTICKLIFIWIVYNILELFNPEAQSALAWFYAVRGVSGYMILIPICMMVFNKKSNLNTFLIIWLFISFLGALYGIKQLKIGLDPFEQKWLAENASTHLLFGHLRVFSFYSDTAQFGISMAHAAIVSTILLVNTKKIYSILGLLLVTGFCMYGLLISGTRSAMIAPFIGLFAYLFLSKNWKILIVGFIFASLAFGVLKFTYIGQSNYNIQRLRSAVKPMEDASFIVRIENQKKLIKYLEKRPFGGGVGSAGYWGKRFSPNTFLANLALDSWYVKIAAEQGFVGLFIYFAMIFYIVTAGTMKIMKIEDKHLRNRMCALMSGIIAVVVVSYSNQYLGQIPTGINIYMSIGFIFSLKG